MYTVVIADKAMMDRLTDYRVLFEPFEKEGQLDFCYWEPERFDIDALPSLRSLIDNRLRWRALILINPLSADNPYDFPEACAPTPSAGERTVSDHPVVRLTQLLGGMRRYVTVEADAPAEPAPEDPAVVATPFHFQTHAVPDALQTKLRLPVRPPESINLLAMRDIANRDDWTATQKSWNLTLEQNASAFWERCEYPDSCRFMVFDVAEDFDALLETDVFRWWMAVLTFAVNQFTPSSLQAYRLYRLNVQLDDQKLRRTLEKMRAKMLSLTAILDQRRALVENDNANATDSGLPALDVTIPVSFSGLVNTCQSMDLRQIGFTSDSPGREEAVWSQWEQSAYENLHEALKLPRRTLERASAQARAETALPDETLPPFNDQVLEDLQERVEKREVKVVSNQINALLLGASVREELSGDAERVRGVLRTRFSSRALQGSVAVLAAALLPFSLRYLLDNAAANPASILIVVGYAVLMALVLWITLLVLRRRLTSAIRAFERHVDAIVQRIITSAKSSGEYLSDVCSFMRGNALLNALLRSRRENADEELPARRHRRRIAYMLELCDAWSHRFAIPLDEKPAISGAVSFDYGIPPAKNTAYRFSDRSSGGSIPIDRSGATAAAPYDFIASLELTREEVYDR